LTVTVQGAHDEIVVEPNAEQDDGEAAWLRLAMVDAMARLIHAVSVEVGDTVGRSWLGD
jgi:hypothetical protein